MSRRNLLRIAAATLLVLCGATASPAQTYPTKPVAVISSFAAGGVTDVVARLYFDIVGGSLGQRFILNSRPGGTGVVGATAVRDAAPDGYTLLFTVGDVLTVLPSLTKMDFNPTNAFEPITLLAAVTPFVTVPASLPVNSMADLVAFAKAKPGGLNFGTQVWLNTLLGAMLADASGAPMTRVDYKGGAPLLIDLVEGRIDMAFTTFALAKAQLEDKKLKYLALAADSRWPHVPDVPAMADLPNVPTLAEIGYSAVRLEGWWGLMAPKNTPRPIIDTLSQEFRKAARDPNLVKRLTELGIGVRSSSPDELGAMITAEAARVAAVVKTHGFKAE